MAIAGRQPGDLSATTVHATRRALLDAIGVMLAASGVADDAKPYRARVSGSGRARVFGSDVRTDPTTAAFANGALAHALDYGDTYDAGPAHPNAALVPALLALAECAPEIDGARFLTAMACGSDLACRLSHAPARPYEEGGWYPPPLFGTIGAAAGCAKLLGIDGDGIVQAIGLAMCQASFPGEIKHDRASPLRGVREAFAARAAVEAALLARDGARAFAAPLEGSGGFFALYGGGDRPGWLNGFGEHFLGDMVSFKPWPSCRGTHAYIEAALILRERITPADIVAIEAEIGPVQEMLIRPIDEKAAPASAIEAKFSLPFTVAAAIIDSAVGLDSFSPDKLSDPAIHAVAAKVGERRNPDWGREHAASGSLTIVTADGTRHHHAVAQAIGHPDRPLSDDALVAKFVTCAARSARPLTEIRATALANRILTLDASTSVAALLADA